MFLRSVLALAFACLLPVAVAQTGKTNSEPALNRDAEIRLLLNPKALAGKPGPANVQELRQGFQNPAAEYRSMPLWVWNDLLEWPRLKEQLEQYKRQGMGGVFVHPRPGLMTEYMGADWFRLWKLSVEEGKKLGLLVNIYDENSYPSGFAGGHVPSRAPDTASQYVQVELDNAASMGALRGGRAFAVFAVEKATDGTITSAKRVRSVAEVPKGASLISYQLRRASGNPWTGEFPYVDLTNPQTAPAFLDSTYEQYKKHVGAEFGKTVRWAFTDEPLLATGGAYDNAKMALPLSYNTLAEFRKRCGYDLLDNLASLYWDVGEFRKVRFDYWQTMHDLWKENFMSPMFRWCDRNNVQFTGHWMEHSWPDPLISPADASLYAYEHVPGIDMLEGANLRTQGKDPHMLFTIKQVASVSHQLGRRVFCEAYGVAGWDSTFEHYKRFGDWLLVHGVNFINQHLSFSTIRGARKRDHPQSFSDVSPWWPYYKLHGDHVGRVSYLSSRSEPHNRLLVLQQTTSGFLLARRGTAAPDLGKMRTNNAELNQFLADHQVDFDLGDEYMLEWFGKVDGRKLIIGRAGYDVVLWPPDMQNVRSQTLPLLEKYLAAGGSIIALSAPAAYVDGRPSDAVKKLKQRYANQWRSVDGLPAALAMIRQRLTPRIEFTGELPAGIGFSERFLANGDRVLFLANTGLKAVSTRASVEGGSAENWDSESGAIAPLAFSSPTAGRISFDLQLEPAGSTLLLVKKALAKPAIATKPDFAPLTAGPWRVQADAPNVLVLDYCDVKIGTETLSDMNTWRANWTIWQRHGFERPAWDNAVQFKTRIFDRNHFAKDSGFEATFRFDVADVAAIPGLQLALESPELFRITVNGTPASAQAGERWLDPHLRSVSIAKLVKPGVNVITISAQPFDVKMELENIYLRGKFSVQASETGFRLGAPKKLGFGSWAAQGMPFYGASVSYETDVEVPAGGKQLRVKLGEWQGSVAAILLDGKQVAVLGWPPYGTEIAVAPGKHKLAVRVISTPRNTLGPFHNPTKPRMRAWPAAWAAFPDHQPGGRAYDVLDYGLTEAPQLSVALSR